MHLSFSIKLVPTFLPLINDNSVTPHKVCTVRSADKGQFGTVTL